MNHPGSEPRSTGGDRVRASASEPAGGEEAASIASEVPGPPDEYDAPAEVDATFRTQRRIAVGYFLIFLVVTLTMPLLALVLDWWSEGELLGSFSPNFAMLAFGLYAFFFAIGLAAASLSTAVEERMLGGPEWPDEGDDQEHSG